MDPDLVRRLNEGYAPREPQPEPDPEPQRTAQEEEIERRRNRPKLAPIRSNHVTVVAPVVGMLNVPTWPKPDTTSDVYPLTRLAGRSYVIESHDASLRVHLRDTVAAAIGRDTRRRGDDDANRVPHARWRTWTSTEEAHIGRRAYMQTPVPSGARRVMLVCTRFDQKKVCALVSVPDDDAPNAGQHVCYLPIYVDPAAYDGTVCDCMVVGSRLILLATYTYGGYSLTPESTDVEGLSTLALAISLSTLNSGKTQPNGYTSPYDFEAAVWQPLNLGSGDSLVLVRPTLGWSHRQFLHIRY
jgi:hypothetical protein